MSTHTDNAQVAQSIEEVMRGELAHGDVILATARPILRHLLANDDHALFSDEVIAKVRGMMVHLARQLLMAVAGEAEIEDRGAFADEKQHAVAQMFLEDTAFLGHAHALTIEAQLADRLQERSGVDAVLSPLLQELTASSDADIAGAAMHLIAAQARFMQQARRMELPLSELPAELFHACSQALRAHSDGHFEASEAVVERLRSDFNESNRRVGQATRLLVAMRTDAKRALDVDHAGLSLFATALSMAAEQERDVAVLSMGENQSARLALTMRAAGLNQAAVEQQFLYLHPELTLPTDFGTLRADQAAAMLAASSPDFAQ
ncbi:hypothetical protein [Aurantiacibacter gangjinensis]|uniref:Uncharacterized protein n=1 Tax=Aurantiacibacter gangjinensis TaxID=502682 RepID=A0A0G9MSD2_9SPHN|nr:hypothetical protein [Aurantiacibacter gangjinensis]APE28817.1 hypothetical protein BMF35_a1988 [Aurantiacibacter gangjinensis]KLE33632.1 hypothetical protein AAW01_02845 [Aurantiacibacter gangjinensis]